MPNFPHLLEILVYSAQDGVQVVCFVSTSQVIAVHTAK